MKLIVYTILLTFCVTTSSHAYLDPGSGGTIIQMIIAFVAAIGATISFYWTKFKLLLNKIFKKKKKDHNKIN